MKEIVLAGIGFKIPIIGFGCSSLTGTGRKNAVRLLETAYDAGVRHFDVARYYGYGEAEKILGTLVKSHRSAMTITTKFGIQPPRRTIGRRLALSVGRRFLRLVPAARRFIQQGMKAVVTTGAFGVNDAQRSLETSLRELGTDYVDFFLLHDYAFASQLSGELLKFLDGAIAAGKIRYFGIGTDIGNVLRALEHRPELCEVIQFENNVLAQNMKRLPERSPSRLVVTHGSLAASYLSILSFLKANRDAAKRWSANLGVDCSSPETIAALMLNYAAQANENGLVLFSSKSPLRVGQNVKAVLEPVVSPAQVELFRQLVERDLMPSIRSELN